MASCVKVVEEELVRNLHSDFNLLDDGTLVGDNVGDVANLKEVDVKAEVEVDLDPLVPSSKSVR